MTRTKLSRAELLQRFAQLQPSVIAMEAAARRSIGTSGSKVFAHAGAGAAELLSPIVAPGAAAYLLEEEFYPGGFSGAME